MMAEAGRTGGTRSPLLDLPKVPQAAEHLIGYLFEVGPTVGEHAVTFTEIRNWSEATGTALNEFQATMLKTLSREFLSMKIEAAQDSCPAPVRPVEKTSEEALAEKREKIAAGLKGFLRSVKPAKRK